MNRLLESYCTKYMAKGLNLKMFAMPEKQQNISSSESCINLHNPIKRGRLKISSNSYY